MTDKPTSEKIEIFEAARRNDVERIRYLIEEKSVPATIVDDGGRTLAHIAAENDNLSIVEYVMEREPSMLATLDNDDYSILHTAVEKGAFNVVKYLVEEHEADITERNRRDLARTAVHTAVQFGRLNILKYFVEERHANVNQPGEWQDRSPVFLAVQYGQRDIRDYLVDDRKADLTTVDFFGENILFAAVKGDDLTFMKRLLDDTKMNFDVNWKNENEETLVTRAVMLNRTSILKYLVDRKRADVNVPQKWTNMTSLHFAASQNDYKLCKYLIAHGARITFKDSSGDLPVQKATDEHLIEYMRNITTKNRSRRNAVVTLTALPKIFHDKEYKPVRVGMQLSRPAEHSVGCTNATILFDGSTTCSSSPPFKSLFIVIAESLRRKNVEGRNFSSPMTDRMDPIAEKAISGILEFEDF